MPSWISALIITLGSARSIAGVIPLPCQHLAVARLQPVRCSRLAAAEAKLSCHQSPLTCRRSVDSPHDSARWATPLPLILDPWQCSGHWSLYIAWSLSPPRWHDEALTILFVQKLNKRWAHSYITSTTQRSCGAAECKYYNYFLPNTNNNLIQWLVISRAVNGTSRNFTVPESAYRKCWVALDGGLNMVVGRMKLGHNQWQWVDLW